MRNVILVTWIGVARMRFEQVIAGGELKRHAGQTPDVCGGVVARADYDFQRTILSCLNIFRKVMILIYEYLQFNAMK